MGMFSSIFFFLEIMLVDCVGGWFVWFFFIALMVKENGQKVIQYQEQE